MVDVPVSALTFTRRQAGWYRAEGAQHHYSVIKDGTLWVLSIHNVATDTRVSRDLWATLTFAKQVACDFEKAHPVVTCRHCQRPITHETRTAPGYLPRTGWYDDLPVDPLVCYQAANLGHVPSEPALVRLEAL